MLSAFGCIGAFLSPLFRFFSALSLVDFSIDVIFLRRWFDQLGEDGKLISLVRFSARRWAVDFHS